ncbi:hypothetical protein Tco_0368217 [Tanacetum coccineum]
MPSWKSVYRVPPATIGNDGTPQQPKEEVMKTYATVLEETKKWIDKDIYSTVDACLNAMKMWKAIKRLKQGESINAQDLETNLYWEFGKFIYDETLDSYYSRFYKMMNELVRNQCEVTNHQVNVQFLLQLKPEWKRFVTLVKQSQELMTVFYHKLYDILKQHQNKVNELRAERLTRTANLLALVAQQQPVYYPQPNLTHYTQSSSTRSQAATKNKEKAIANSPLPTYDSEPKIVADDEASSKEKEIEKLMALISMSFKKNYKPTNNNLRTSSNTMNMNVDNTPRSNRRTRYDRQIGQCDNQRAVNVVGARENVATQVVQQTGIQCFNCKEFGLVARECKKAKQARDSAFTRKRCCCVNAANNSGPIFDTEPFKKVHNNDDKYNLFANERHHPEQPESVNDTYLVDQGDTNTTPDSSDMSNNKG